MIAWLLRKLRRKPKPKGPAHIYPLRGSVMERYFGEHRCMFCPRFDPDETLFTSPPCPRNLKELA